MTTNSLDRPSVTLLRFGAGILSALMLIAAAPVGQINPPCVPLPARSNNATMSLRVDSRSGSDILRIEGRIGADIPQQLATMFEQHPRITEVWLNSSGGDISAANAAGRIIRSRRGLFTRVPDGWACADACNFLFMGGSGRSVHPRGIYMVPKFAAKRAQILNATAALLLLEEADYLIRMGVSRRLLTEVIYRPMTAAELRGNRSPRRCLTSAELFQYNVANIQD